MLTWVAVDILAVYFGLDVLVNLVFLAVFLAVFRRRSPAVPRSATGGQRKDTRRSSQGCWQRWR